ncbi:MFS transporter [Streptomyces sp. SL13]|uniref:MFS transporter n=1 Tax=Streptantibioticus silvisoli TaxID=2705255 RepID=A0AA90H850_9ACTN|nr:MFS transporter [Streptantibioticus silvisoli]MDI5972668.1 MFS transporter [Streptantibioticus silvisoli]
MESHEPRAPGGTPPGRGFRLLWAGETTSKVGTAVTSVALPLLATLTLRSSAFQIGLIAAAQWLPWLLVGLPAGAWVDRWDPRRVMLWCDLLSALAVVGVPVAAAAGVLTFGQVLVAAFVLGLAGVFFSTAYQVYLPLVVAEDRLVGANARLQGSESGAQIAGPSLGGLLTQVFGAAAGLLVDAVSFAVSAACLLASPAPAGAARVRGGRPEPVRRAVREGLRFVLGDRLLRRFTLVAALTNLTATATETLLVIFLVRTVHLPAGTVGVLMAVGGTGGVLGALAAVPLAGRLGEARVARLSLVATAPFGLLVPLTARGPALALFVVGAAVPVAGMIVYNVVVSSFRQQHVPRGMLGRISATMRFLMFGVIPLGALAGGALGSLIGPRAALWWVAGAALLPGVLLTLSPLRRMSRLTLLPVATASAPSGGA